MHPIRLTAAAAALAASFSSHALVTVWDGASGLLPEQVDPAWTLIDEGGGSPSFAGGVLQIQTSGGHSSRQYYNMAAGELDFSAGAPFWMEAEVKLISGSQTGGWWRAPIHMSFRLDNGLHAILEIRPDYIYLRDADNHRTVFALVDTDDAFHTYRLEVLGSTSSALVKVYQDGNLVLSDTSLYVSGAASGSLSFGEASTLATGTSQWKRVSHNMAAVATPQVPEPSTYALMAAGLAAVGAVVRRRRTH